MSKPIENNEYLPIEYKGKRIRRDKWFNKEGELIITYPHNDINNFEAKGRNYNIPSPEQGAKLEIKLLEQKIQSKKVSIEQAYNLIYDFIEHYEEAIIVCKWAGVVRKTKDDINASPESKLKAWTIVKDWFVKKYKNEIKELNISREEEELVISTEAPNPKRQAVEALILKYIAKIVTGDANVKLYQDLFKSMNDQQFDQFMNDLKNDQRTLSVIVPNNDSRFKVNIENNLKLGKELGFEFFQHLKVGKTEYTPEYTTPNKYLVLKLPVRRAAQLLTKKISIPKDNFTTDMMTGQVTNGSAASKFTNPELQVLLGVGLKASSKELMKTRGGDLGESAALDGMLIKHGSVSQEQLEQYSTEVGSKKTLRAYLNGMHIRNTL